MNYYTFIKADEYITVSGNGADPTNCQDITWKSSRGAQGVLEQMDGIEDVYAPIIGFVSVNDYKNNMYVQIAKFGAIYKNGWRFGEANLPTIEPDVTKSEVLEKSKTKKRVYVKGTGKRASYWRMQEVGREEVDPKKIDNLWDISLDRFQRLVSGDKQLLVERYIGEHKYDAYEEHPTLKDLLKLAPLGVQYNNEGRLAFFDEPDINVHTKAIYQTLRDVDEVPVYVLRDYPEIAEEFDIDISDSALEREAATIDVKDRSKLIYMPRYEFESIVESVKPAYDKDPKHVTDKVLKQDYEEELADCKRAAKLRKKIFNNLPGHMQFGYTPETMDAKLHKSMVWYAKNNGHEIPGDVKAGYPTIYTDQPFNYEMTGNAECDTAANDILTQIRDKLGTNTDEWYNHVKISHIIHDIIGATDESVPIMYGAGVEPGMGEEIAESVVNVISSTLIGSDLKDRIKNFKKSTGRARVMIAYDDGIRSYQSGGVITLGTYYSKTVAHEYGHAIDWMLPEINELSQAFLNRRTEDEPLVSLAEIIPQGGYADDELAKPDNFMEAYIGKRYDHNSSEVLSMGMGYMSSSGGMMAMYEQDPEYLGYIVAVLSGRARGAEVTHGLMRGPDEPGAYEPANKSETIEIDLYELSRGQMAEVVTKLTDKGLLKFEIPDELLEQAGIDPKKMDPKQLAAMFAELSKKGLLKDKPGDKKPADKKPTAKEPEDTSGSGRPGLVKKKVTVHRGGKTFEQYRWVKVGEDEPTEKPKKGEEEPGEKSGKGDRKPEEKPSAKPEPEKPKGPVIIGLNDKPEGEDKELEDVKVPEPEEKEPDKAPEDKKPTTKGKPEKFEMAEHKMTKELDAMEAGLPESAHGMELSLCEFGDNKAIYKYSGDEMDTVGEAGYHDLAETIGWDMVPQTEIVDLGAGEGSCQAFVNGKHPKWSDSDENVVKITEDHFEDIAQIFAMDVLVGNLDRHDENMIIDEDGKVWAIDNDTWTGNSAGYDEDNIDETFKALDYYCGTEADPGEEGFNKTCRFLSYSLDEAGFKKFRSVLDTKLTEIVKHEKTAKEYYYMDGGERHTNYISDNVKYIEKYLGENK